MAEESQDQSQKTEEPTQRRVDEAREKGEVASSREVGHWFMLVAAAVATAAAAPASVASLVESLAGTLARAGDLSLDPATLVVLVQSVGQDFLFALALPFGLFVAAAILAGLIQHGPVLSLEPIQPKLDRLSPIKGVERLFSLRALVELAKGVAKLAIVGGVCGAVLWPERGRVVESVALDPALAGVLLGELSLRLLVAAAAVMAFVAGADLLFQKLQHHRQMRMTRQEVRDEFKQTEGDPTVKARLRQLRLERARRRMMAAVPQADVVVTNPTHFAVALKYDMASMPAPKVVAKGADRIAKKIREVAEENQVPVVENPPLARALYETTDLDSYVPEHHYKAVAGVIGYVMRLKGKLPPRPPSRPRPPRPSATDRG
ncbi:MAG: flagellar biosynthesis protein FlhB [Alphaproteobacteria bacterium]